jgi:hypothetical protein
MVLIILPSIHAEFLESSTRMPVGSRAAVPVTSADSLWLTVADVAGGVIAVPARRYTTSLFP